MFVKIIGTIVGLIGVFWMFIAGIAFEHRPAGWPNLMIPIGPFHWTFRLPDSPEAQLEALKAAEATAAKRAASVTAETAAITAQAGQHEAAAQTQIRVVHDVQIKEVPTYVTAQVDRGFPIPWALVRVRDAAAGGVDLAAISLPPGQSDDAASPVPASAFGGVLVDDYGACRANAEQLTALQAWVRQTKAAWSAPAAAPTHP